MSNKTGKTGHKRPRVDVTKLVTRIIVLILCAMMVLGSVAMAVYYGMSAKKAMDATQVASRTSNFVANHKMRVGLIYGSTSRFSTALSASGGFSLGYVNSDNSYTEVWQVTDSTVSVACDFHLKGSGSAYSKGSEDDCTVGGYHIVLRSSRDNIFGMIDEVNRRFDDGSAFSYAVADESQYYAFPGIRGGYYCVLVGDFASSSKAEAAMEALKDAYPDAYLVSPNDDGVTVVSSGGRVLYDFVPTDDGAEIGLVAKETGTPIKYGSYIYNGVFEYQRDGGALRLINVIDLERYIEGVLPYEISRSWPVESQKAFAVTVRNYSLTHIGEHSDYDFDVCTTTCCEVYRGCTKTNQTVIDCVKATEGIVTIYNGEIQKQWYSSSVGGTTVDVHDCWGGTRIPYLEAIATPWENYENYNNGSWTVEYSPANLAATLREHGYSAIKGDVTSVKINEFSKNSTYAISVTVTDDRGNSVTIKNSDMIRVGLGLRSANFVVGKAGQRVKVTDYGLRGYGDFADGTGFFEKIHLMTGSGAQSVTASDPIYALTGSGKQVLDWSSGFWLRHATGTDRFMPYNQDDLPVTKYTGKLDFNGLDTVSRTYEITLDGDEGNFVFVGRGWGHGVGSSQNGYLDLARMGYVWQEIISFYYEDCKLVDYESLLD